MIILLLLAILPPLLIAYNVYQKDKYEKEPTILIVKSFIFGCVSVIPAIILENIYNYFFKKKFDTKYTLDKDIYHKIYHHSKNRLFKTSFGKKNKNKVFFVIKRTPGGGFFSNFIF